MTDCRQERKRGASCPRQNKKSCKKIGWQSYTLDTGPYCDGKHFHGPTEETKCSTECLWDIHEPLIEQPATIIAWSPARPQRKARPEGRAKGKATHYRHNVAIVPMRWSTPAAFDVIMASLGTWPTRKLTMYTLAFRKIKFGLSFVIHRIMKIKMYGYVYVYECVYV